MYSTTKINNVLYIIFYKACTIIFQVGTYWRHSGNNVKIIIWIRWFRIEIKKLKKEKKKVVNDVNSRLFLSYRTQVPTYITLCFIAITAIWSKIKYSRDQTQLRNVFNIFTLCRCSVNYVMFTKNIFCL